MRNLRILSLGCVAVLGALWAGGAVAQTLEDEVDPRVRTYVWPVRVVWTTPQVGYRTRFRVKNPEALIRPSTALKHASGVWKGVGCELVNEGLPAGILLDFGREIHGGVQIVSGRDSPWGGLRARVRFGESVGEAMSDIGEKGATNDHAARDEEITLPISGFAEFGNTGFRFVRIDLLSRGKLCLNAVRAVSLMRPMERLGSFKSSDPRLDAVWETAVRTVHLCCQDYLWDGIKRDRLAWMGDTHPEISAILPVFGAADVLPRTFEYMEFVTPKGQWMNGYPNYTFWYLRNVWEWWRFTGDRAFLDVRRDYLAQTLDQVIAHVTPGGRFDQQGFLDWPTKHNPTAVTNGTHALCAATLDCGAELATAFGDAALAKRCTDAAARLRTVRLDAAGAKSAAALLALGGIQDPKKMFADVLGRDGHAGVSTFYGYYMLEAMSAAGEDQRALDTVRDYWGGMLDMGATSFWEDFNLAWTNGATRVDEMPVAGRPDIHGDFGEFCYPGYRHSLCHGWSAGPAAWCMSHVLGIRILEPGCRKIAVRPFLGDLEWAEGTMATPFGPVRVRVEKKPSGELDVKVDAPPEVTVVR